MKNSTADKSGTAMYVFGVWPGERNGHHLRDEEGRMMPMWKTVPWRSIDGALCPWSPGHQTEGLALLHHLEDWTALAFWDRSEDHRYGSNTVFFVKMHLDAEAMVAMCRERFPAHFARYTFEVKVMEERK